jgi:hypothetical protein
MLLQTNSYVVPKDKRNEHARLVRRFRQSLAKLGCEHFEVYEQVSQNWGGQDSGGRFVQIMRFRDRRHQLDVQAAERTDPAAQALIQEFCELINFPFQQQQGLFAVGFYNSVLPTGPSRETDGASEEAAPVAAGEAVAPETSPDAPFPASSASAQPDSVSPSQNSTNEPGSPAVRRSVVPPIFFESTVADSLSPPPAAHSAADDQLDEGPTDLSDSDLMNLSESTSSEAPLREGQLASEPQVGVAVAEPAEAQDAAASVEHAELHYSHADDDAAEEHDHLEGHTDIEPEKTAEAHSLPEPIQHHSHMRLAQNQLDEEHSTDDFDVELFEPEEPVSPFGD